MQKKKLRKNERRLLQAYLLARAREDPGVFNGLCFRDKAGRRWETQPFQLEWHRLLEEHDRVVIFAPVGHGKTEQIARSWVLRRLARFPNETGAIVCNTYSQAAKRVRVVAEDITSNPVLRMIYPDLRPEDRPGRITKWTEGEIIIRREISSKDPSVYAVGLHGALLGARLDWVILDDPCDQENTLTAAMRDRDMEWVRSTLMSRLEARSKMAVIMTAWHEDDIGHRLVREHGFHVARYEACDDNLENRLWKPREYLEQARRDMGEREWNRAMRNLILSDSTARIRWEWIQTGLDRGKRVPPSRVPGEAKVVVTGVDLAAGKRRDSSQVAMCTIALLPDGSRQLIDVWADRLTFPEIIEAIKGAHAAYGGEIVTEDNVTQVYVREYLQANEKSIPVFGHVTTARKWDPATGVESIAIELQRGQWIIPADAEGRPANDRIRQFCTELYSFDPMSHTGDMLMACYIARTRLREVEARQRASHRGSIMLPHIPRQDEGWLSSER